MRIARFLFTKAQAAHRHAVWFIYCRPTGKRGGLVGVCTPHGDPDIERALGLPVRCRWCKREVG